MAGHRESEKKAPLNENLPLCKGTGRYLATGVQQRSMMWGLHERRIVGSAWWGGERGEH